MKLLRIPIIALTWLLTQVMPSCAQKTGQEFHEMLDSRFSYDVPLIKVDSLAKLDKVVLLDTREKEEYEVSHIKNARWIGYDDFDLERIKDIPKDAFIVTYCSVGYRSNEIGKKLEDAGYTNVHNLYGSIFEWVNQGYPVYDTSGNETTRVHAYNRSWGIWLLRGEKVY